MNLQDITTWTVTPDHKATPKNPYALYDDDRILNIDHLNYNDFIREHTYHCSPSLVAGEYPTADVELVWQYRNANFNDIHHEGKYWLNVLTGAFDSIEQTVEYYESDGYNTRQYLQLKQPVKDTRDASHFEILSNVPGKEQDGIDMPILKLWGEVENFYGDPHKNETGRQLLMRIQDEYNISFKPLIVPKGYWNCGGCEMDYDAGSLGDDSKCPVCNITCDMVLVEDHPTMVEPESKEVESDHSIQHLPHVQKQASDYFNSHWYSEEKPYVPCEPVIEAYCQGYEDDFQFKTNPIEVIKNRIKELEEIDSANDIYSYVNAVIEDYKHILKLIQ